MFVLNIPSQAAGRTVVTFHLPDDLYPSAKFTEPVWRWQGNESVEPSIQRGRIAGDLFDTGEHVVRLELSGQVYEQRFTIPPLPQPNLILIRTQQDLDRLIISDNCQVIFQPGDYRLLKPIVCNNRRNVHFVCNVGQARWVSYFPGSMVTLNSLSSNIVFQRVIFAGASPACSCNSSALAGNGIAFVECGFETLHNAIYGFASPSNVLIDRCRQIDRCVMHFAYITGTNWIIRRSAALFGSASENLVRIPGPDKGIGPAAQRVGLYDLQLATGFKSCINPRTPRGLDIADCSFTGNNKGAGLLAIGPRSDARFRAADIWVRSCVGVGAGIQIGPGTSDVLVEDCRVETVGLAPMIISTYDPAVAFAFLGDYTIRNCSFNAENIRLQTPVLWTFSRDTLPATRQQIQQGVKWENNRFNQSPAQKV